jgi:hypothetical protein
MKDYMNKAFSVCKVGNIQVPTIILNETSTHLGERSANTGLSPLSDEVEP